MRSDPQNLPAELIKKLKKPWPGTEYGSFGGGDFSGALTERAELYDFIRDQRIDGFVIVSGDRHSFWAGYAAKALPPQKFEPVGVAFVTGSISAPGLAEALEHGLKDHPLRPLFAVERPGGKYENTINLTLKHGVKSALEYSKSGDLAAAHQVSNSDNAPHLEFVDMRAFRGAYIFRRMVNGSPARLRLLILDWEQLKMESGASKNSRRLWFSKNMSRLSWKAS